MNIVALEGEGAINDVRRRQTRVIVVQVRDGNRNPISGATVNFTLPVQGASGIFANGAKTVTATSDQNGHATVHGFRPGSTPGKLEIRVNASRNDERATLVITQFNMAVSGSGGSGKWIALLGIVGGAAAGGAYAFTRSSGNPAGAPSTAPVTITPGTGSVGRPR